jgi:hypothetical protein
MNIENHKENHFIFNRAIVSISDIFGDFLSTMRVLSIAMLLPILLLNMKDAPISYHPKISYFETNEDSICSLLKF